MTATKTYYQNLILSKILNSAKFPVMIGTIPSSKERFAVKIFPFQEGQINGNYVNEILFANLRHPNIASILHYEHVREATFQYYRDKISYIIMELAPYGDFCDLMISRKLKMDDKLARTYFRQLLEGVEYLHSVNVAHLDLKLENLLIGKNYNLKICDFDQAYLKGQPGIVSRGTLNFRAPELNRKQCQNPEAADVYSLGVILFALKCGGYMPYCENEKFNGVDFFDLLKKDPKLFWVEHCKVQGRKSLFFDDDFKTLFEGMVSDEPEKRPNIEQVKQSKWYNGCIHTQNDLEVLMKKTL